MAVQWIESFDKYGSSIANLAHGGWVLAGTQSISSSGGRTGRYIQQAATASSIYRQVAAHLQGTFGTAFHQVGSGTGEIVAFLGLGGSTPLITVRTGTSGQINVYNGTHTGTLLGTSANSVITVGSWHYVEVSYVISTTVGAVEVRVDGVTVITITGANTGSSNVERISPTSLNSNVVSRRWDDIYWSDSANDFQGPIAVECLIPNAAGSNADWTRGGSDTGANYSQVNEDGADADSTYISAASTNQTDTYNLPNLSGTGTIKFVQVTNRARTETSGRQVSPAILLSGTVYAPVTTSLVSTTYINLAYVWSVNPATGIAFTVADVNGMEAGVKIVS